MNKVIKGALVICVQLLVIWLFMTNGVYIAGEIATSLVDDGVPHGFGASAPIALGIMAIVNSVYLSYMVLKVPEWLGKRVLK